MTTASPSSPSLTLSPFRSRWRTPCAWAWATARHTPRTAAIRWRRPDTPAAPRGRAAWNAAAASRRVGPASRGMVKNLGRPSAGPTSRSYSGMMLGWRKRDRISASAARASAPPPRRSARGRFSATSRPRWSSWASQTSAAPPRPIASSRVYRPRWSASSGTGARAAKVRSAGTGGSVGGIARPGGFSGARLSGDISCRLGNDNRIAAQRPTGSVLLSTQQRPYTRCVFRFAQLPPTHLIRPGPRVVRTEHRNWRGGRAYERRRLGETRDRPVEFANMSFDDLRLATHR